jgi:methionine-gamma-lyase
VLTVTGNHIVAHQTLDGCTHSLLRSWLPRYKIRTNFCDLTKPESLAKVATKNCRMVYLETPVGGFGTAMAGAVIGAGSYF